MTSEAQFSLYLVQLIEVLPTRYLLLLTYFFPRMTLAQISSSTRIARLHFKTAEASKVTVIYVALIP